MCLMIDLLCCFFSSKSEEMDWATPTEVLRIRSASCCEYPMPVRLRKALPSIPVFFCGVVLYDRRPDWMNPVFERG